MLLWPLSGTSLGDTMSKPRTRVTMNTRTEVMKDRRTRRLRTRSAEESAAIALQEMYADEYHFADGTCRAGRYCCQHTDLWGFEDLGYD